METWRELQVWQDSHKLVLKIYELIARLPIDEKYAISDQIKRSAYSVPSNIVEGFSKPTTKDFLKFLYISRGSLEELRYFLLLIKDLKYIKQETYDYFETKITKISKQLNGLIKSLKEKL